MRILFTVLIIFYSNFSFASICEELLVPSIDLTHSIPANSYPYEKYVDPISSLSNDPNLDHVESDFITSPIAFFDRHHIPFLKDLKATNISATRSGLKIGKMALVNGKWALLQDPIPVTTMDATERSFQARSMIYQVLAAEIHVGLPIVGYTYSKEGFQLIRPLVAGTSLFPLQLATSVVRSLPLRINFPKFDTNEILDFEKFMDKLSAIFGKKEFAISPPHGDLESGYLDIAPTTPFSFSDGGSRSVLSPTSSHKIPETILKSMFLGTKIILRPQGDFLLEDFNWTEVLNRSHDNPEALLSIMDGGDKVFAWSSWIRALVQRTIYMDVGIYYRSFLWKNKSQTLFELDHLNLYIATRNYKVIPNLGPGQGTDLHYIFGSSFTDSLKPYVRPSQALFTKKSLKYHFKKHGMEMNAGSMGEYEDKARHFILTSVASDFRTYVQRENGDIALYDRLTNEFAVFNTDGIIRTYFVTSPSFHGKGENNEIYIHIKNYEAWEQEFWINPNMN